MTWLDSGGQRSRSQQAVEMAKLSTSSLRYQSPSSRWFMSFFDSIAFDVSSLLMEQLYLTSYLPTKGDGRLCFCRLRYVATYIGIYVCEQLPGASSSPIVTKLGQSYLWPQWTRWLSFGRSRSKIKVGGGGMHPTLCRVGQNTQSVNRFKLFGVFLYSFSVTYEPRMGPGQFSPCPFTFTLPHYLSFSILYFSLISYSLHLFFGDLWRLS